MHRYWLKISRIPASIYEWRQFTADPNKNLDLVNLGIYHLILDYALLNYRGLFGLGGGMHSTECHSVFVFFKRSWVSTVFLTCCGAPKWPKIKTMQIKLIIHVWKLYDTSFNSSWNKGPTLHIAICGIDGCSAVRWSLHKGRTQSWIYGVNVALCYIGIMWRWICQRCFLPGADYAGFCSWYLSKTNKRRSYRLPMA